MLQIGWILLVRQRRQRSKYPGDVRQGSTPQLRPAETPTQTHEGLSR